jgi:hypothetical protein
MSRYELNRANIPLGELRRYDGQWVALAADGSRILAGAATIAELEDHLTTIGQDPQHVAFERIELEDSQLGGAELL